MKGGGPWPPLGLGKRSDGGRNRRWWWPSEFRAPRGVVGPIWEGEWGRNGGLFVAQCDKESTKRTGKAN